MTSVVLHQYLAPPGEPLSSSEGLERLVRSGQAERFFQLANFYQFQTDNYSCGPTSAAIVLNALRYGTKTAPLSGDGIRAYSPQFLVKQLPKTGMELDELYRTIVAQNLSVEKQVVTQSSRALQRDLLVALMQEPNTHIIVNFARHSSGHFSPLGALDRFSNSVLVLDTNPSQKPWLWIDLEDLLDAMQTRDNQENRGFLIIRSHHG